ncbi:MucB/RseB C-terminal domain-containing protein [Simiduia sp. 21SJ11W-1]|uniref:MucB/RseB C-terminal domain-containing protein n=1 Tax=Simiduia sp. 21SJ11W-1 TaxID=2909669 RepID=UPI00209F28C0|nr:MucB/RseB C-terminal domain-containing protein [Simiduia sp. 21SJ11W-1]UTA46289.1 MucB/RseB C-terminal domain-containing protein [Simiduia sp. 21SJ11W-1]
MKPLLTNRLGLPRAFVFILLTICAAPALADDARALLARHAQAMATLNYSGVLTYEHGAHLATMELEHRVVGGVEQERLVHLNGEHRAISRNAGLSHCPSAGERLLRGVALGADNQDIDAYYHISTVGKERIAGRQATLVQVMPRDQHRYGYVLALDDTTYIALKVIFIGQGARVLERFQFATLNVEGEASQAAGEQAATQQAVSLADARAVDCGASQISAGTGRWLSHWLPPGFELVATKQLSGKREMLAYSDGLAAFSIFIDAIDTPSIIEGRAQRGATVAYMGKAELAGHNFRVTAVGEIPAPSLERVAMSLGPVEAELAE